MKNFPIFSLDFLFYTSDWFEKHTELENLIIRGCLKQNFGTEKMGPAISESGQFNSNDNEKSTRIFSTIFWFCLLISLSNTEIFKIFVLIHPCYRKWEGLSPWIIVEFEIFLKNRMIQSLTSRIWFKVSQGNPINSLTLLFSLHERHPKPNPQRTIKTICLSRKNLFPLLIFMKLNLSNQ